MKNGFVLIIFMVIFSACKKEPLPVLPDENEPYYSIRGDVNDDSINWIVGLDDATFTYGVGEMNGINTYYGQINAGTGDMAVKIEILEPEIFYNGSSVAAISSQTLNYLVHEPGAIKFNFGLNYSQFNYILIKNESGDFEYMTQVNFTEFGIHPLTMKFTDYSSSESFNIPVCFGFEKEQISAEFTSSGQGDTLHTQPSNLEGTHAWYLNNELVSNEAQLVKPMQDGIYSLRHEYTDISGNQARYETLIRFLNGEHYWQMKYYYLIPEDPTSHYGNVIVSMKKDGQWYSSEHCPLNLEQIFHTANISTYVNSDLQPESTKFDFSFESVLYNDNQTDSLHLDDMTGTISVGIK
ncbi:MAG: hypothetical protein IPM74_13100 [Crocinitomicaceae bacterium]|nr:hypothetical protein [Crocinitomicaceae bacterium]MBK8926811.1 hypothetical protein [Crocinitomicaceae bacterium]